MNPTTEDRAKQLQLLIDILNQVKDDPDYRNILNDSCHRPDPDALSRRMSQAIANSPSQLAAPKSVTNYRRKPSTVGAQNLSFSSNEAISQSNTLENDDDQMVPGGDSRNNSTVEHLEEGLHRTGRTPTPSVSLQRDSVHEVALEIENPQGRESYFAARDQSVRRSTLQPHSFGLFSHIVGAQSNFQDRRATLPSSMAPNVTNVKIE